MHALPQDLNARRRRAAAHNPIHSAARRLQSLTSGRTQGTGSLTSEALTAAETSSPRARFLGSTPPSRACPRRSRQCQAPNAKPRPHRLVQRMHYARRASSPLTAAATDDELSIQWKDPSVFTASPGAIGMVPTRPRARPTQSAACAGGRAARGRSGRMPGETPRLAGPRPLLEPICAARRTPSCTAKRRWATSDARRPSISAPAAPGPTKPKIVVNRQGTQGRADTRNTCTPPPA